MVRGWVARVCAVATGVVLAFTLTSGRAGAANSAKQVDLVATAGSGTLHLAEGGSATIDFGYTASRGVSWVGIELDLKLPSSVQTSGEATLGAGGSSCHKTSRFTFICSDAPSSLTGHLTITAPVGSAPASGSYRVNVFASSGDYSTTRTVAVDKAGSDLALSFTPGTAAVGQVATVVVAIHNNGPGQANWGLQVAAPAGTEYLGCTPSPCAQGLGINVGQTVQVSLAFRVTDNAIGAGSWSATTAGVFDPVPANSALPALGSLIHVTGSANTSSGRGGAGSDGGNGASPAGSPSPSAGAPTSGTPAAPAATIEANAGPSLERDLPGWLLNARPPTSAVTVVTVVVCAALLCLLGAVIGLRRLGRRRRSTAGPD